VWANAARVARKSGRSCVVQRERGAVPTRVGRERVPSDASDSFSASYSAGVCPRGGEAHAGETDK